MVFDYRGKIIQVKDRYIEDYERFNGYKFDNDEIDTYIYNEYIWDRKRENEIPQIVDKLSVSKIERIIEKYLVLIMRVYTGNLHYEDIR